MKLIEKTALNHPMEPHQSTIEIHDSSTDADAAIKGIKALGVHQKKLSIVACAYVEDPIIFEHENDSDTISCNVSRGAFRDLFSNGTVGSALFMIPGIGLLMMAGPVVATMAGALDDDSAQSGLGLLGDSLCNLGVSLDSMEPYETALRADKFLLIEHSSEPVSENHITRRYKNTDCCDRYGHQDPFILRKD
ncbi:MAG: hypothetical protein P1V20_03500 [Verrucomicrobiales bacterium]|nr:hypothetical protein [Verrucomicrobiales bacterium]